MGWIRDDGQDWSYDHEGYLVAVVQEDGRWRQLGRGDEGRDTLFGCMLQVRCECGWASQRQTPPLASRWSPYMVTFRGEDGEAYEDAAAELWERHMAESSEKARHELMNRGMELERARWAERLRLVTRSP